MLKPLSELSSLADSFNDNWQPHLVNADECDLFHIVKADMEGRLYVNDYGQWCVLLSRFYSMNGHDPNDEQQRTNNEQQHDQRDIDDDDYPGH